MIENPAVQVLEAAQAEIDALASKVGLVRAQDFPAIKEAVEPPPGAALWTSSYGRLLLWPLATDNPSMFESGMIEAEGWLDAALRQFESDIAGRPLDGYLILALPNAPAADAYDEIRRIELSSRICRKHLIWPNDATGDGGGGRWSRVADVTVLGLPATVMAPTGELQWPGLDPGAADVWQNVSVNGGKEAARIDAEQLGLDGDRP